MLQGIIGFGLVGVCAGAALHPGAAQSALQVTRRSTTLSGVVGSISAPIVAVNNKAIMPDGANIEIIGVTDSKTLPGSKLERCWKPDGSSLPHPPATPSILTLYHRQKVLKDANRDLILLTSGIDPENTSVGVEYTPTATMSSLQLNPGAPYSVAAARYDSVAWFDHVQQPRVMRVKLARGAWQITASTPALPATVPATDDTTVIFSLPNKDATPESVLTRATRAAGGTGLAVRIQSHKPIVDMARRLQVIDDKGNATLVNADYASLYTRDQGQKDEYDIYAVVPGRLRGHIKAYQLQVRPYQYVDFPNIHLEPVKP